MGNWYTGLMKDEVPYEDILAKAENGEFHEWNYECSPFSDTEYGYEDVLEILKQYKAEDYLKLKEQRDSAKKSGNTEDEKKYQAQMDKMVNDVYDIYREKNVYPTAYFSEFGIMQEIEKCIAYKAFWNGNTVSCGSGVGTTLCKFLFPNLQDTPSKHDLDKKGAESIFAKFNNEKYLKRAVQFCFSYKDGCPVPTAVEGGLRLVGSAPSNFRPMNAKAIYERFCPEGGTIYDFCCVDDETEFFNGIKWKSLADYKEGDKVLQYNEDGTAELVDPIEYIHYQSDEPFYEYEDSGLSSCQTGNHDVVIKENGKCIKVKQDSILHKETKGIPVSCIYDGDLDISYDELVKVISDVENHEGKRYDSSYYKLSRRSKLDFIKALIDGEYAINTVSRPKEFTFYEDINYNVELAAHIISTSGFGCFYIDGGLVFTLDSSYTKGSYSTMPEYDSPFKEVHKKDKYCFVVPSHMLVLRRNGKVYITGNCGFGGRMLGALSSQKNFKYVGTDPNTETMYHLHQLGEYIEQVTGREDSFELHCCGSEEFKGKPNSIDFAFSSPPYFDLEVYSDEPTQCYNKFPELDAWLEGYVRQTIKNIAYMLKPGRCYAVNIADFRVGSGGECAYVDEWIRLSTEEGMPLFDTVYLGVTARAGSAEQAAGELKKENILIFKKPL